MAGGMGLARLQRVWDEGAEPRSPVPGLLGIPGKKGRRTSQYPPSAIATSSLSVSLFSPVSISLSDPSIPKQGDMEWEGGRW